MTGRVRERITMRIKIPPLDAYLARVGAEELNFKSWMIKEYIGSYYAERAVIRIVNGEIRCSRKEFAPTKDEAEAIKIALQSVTEFPRSIQAINVDELRAKLGPDAVLYEFYDRRTGNIVMVQQRVMKPDGHKIYPPWSLWSDGEWRNMEPECELPLWKPRERRGKARIMIHEGPKAAKFCDDLCNDKLRKKELKAHPWGEELANYEHWGMIGGALSPHRTDYSQLRTEKPNEVIYVCDNDSPGKQALQEVSKHWGTALKGVLFDDRWPEHFDLADPWPKDFFREGRHCGPSLKQLLIPATYATETVPPADGKGKPTHKITRDFKDEWFHCVVPEVFVHRDWPNKIYNKEEFNNFVSPYSAVRDTALLLQNDAAAKGTSLTYSPQRESGIFSGPEGRHINTHVVTSIKAEKGDASPFLDYMAHLITNEDDRHEVLRWTATLIARPDIKMLYGLLMISETQGVGKSTLGEKILAPLVGAENVSYPQENEIVDSNYNYWLAHKRLAVVHEIYAGHSSKAYNRLKSVITDRIISVSKKYQANYEVENWTHIYACSNSSRALHLPNDDRRWFVPKINENTKPVSYWLEFNDWLNDRGGLRIIKHWAEQFVQEHKPVMPGEAAPNSAMKRELIEDSLSPGQQIAAQILDSINRGISDPDTAKFWRERGYLTDKGIFVLDKAIIEVIRNELYDGRHSDRLERPATIRRLAKARGWHIGEHKTNIKEWVNGSKNVTDSIVIATTKELASTHPAKLCNNDMKDKEKLRPIDLSLVRGM